jgi:tripartite-type tricarboxylate transporter receptor subunit TctC
MTSKIQQIKIRHNRKEGSLVSRLALPALLICAGAAFVASGLRADDYPARPVRVIIPFAAGGTFDLVGRAVAQKLGELWGQQVVADNRPGGATIIAADLVAKSNPDGYTIYLSPNSLAANPSLHAQLPYAQRDLQPVVLVAAQPMALGAHPSFNVNSIKELIDIAKSSPGGLNYGTAGIGSGGYLAGEIFKLAAGIDIVHISYKGGNLAMLEVMANQINMVMTGLPNLLPQYKAGKIKILAVTDAKRSAVAREIPAIGETVPGYEFRNWFGLIVAGGTPAPLIRRINADVNKILDTGDTRQRLLDQGFEVIGGTTQEFDRVIKADTIKFAKVLKGAANRAN